MSNSSAACWGVPGRPTRALLALVLVGVPLLGGAPPGRAAADDAAADTAEAASDAGLDEAPVDEVVVTGVAPPSMDVLAGATSTRIDVDTRLVEGQQISDLLAEIPGVQIRRYGGVGERFEISIRGSRPEQVPVFLDGIRLDTSLTGSSDLSTVCLDVLDEIQVVRGAGAARSGSGAIGGVVNLVSRKAGLDPDTRARVSGGNFGTAEASVRHARQIGKGDVSLAYCGFHTDGDFRFQQKRQESGGIPIGSTPILTRINNEADRHTALAHAGHPLGPGELRFTGLVTHLARGVPGAEADQRARAHETIFSTLSSVGWDAPVQALRGASVDFLVSHRYEDSDYRDPDPIPPRDAIDTGTGVHNLTARGGGKYERDLVGGHHVFSLLAESRFDERLTNLANTRQRAGGALRAELESGFWSGRLRISPSLRLEAYEHIGPKWIPGLHVRGRPLEWLELRGAVARSYRLPSFQELYLPDRGFERGNPNLHPEDAVSGEVGAALRSPFESPWLDLTLEGTAFWSRIDQSIAFQLISTNVVAPVNTGRARTQGYELSLRYAPHPWATLIASRTETHAEITSAPGDPPVPGIARSLSDVRLELGPPDRLRVVGEMHHAGRIWVSGGKAAYLPARFTFDASVALDLAQIDVLRADRIARSLWLTLRGRNLGNESVRDGRFFPRPGRNFAVALEGRF